MLDRKAFNFYKSYYDVAKELPEQDRNEFVWSIISAEFTGNLIEPKSKLAKLMFLGQKHSILKQLEGFKGATQAPLKGPTKGATKGPSVQVQGQVQGQEEVKEYGTKSELSFAVKPKYIGDIPCRVYESGFDEYIQIHQMGISFRKPYMKDLFWKEWNGKIFNDHQHVNTVITKISNNIN